MEDISVTKKILNPKVGQFSSGDIFLGSQKFFISILGIFSLEFHLNLQSFIKYLIFSHL